MPPGPVSSAKARPDAEPFIDLDTMIDLTAKASVNGVKFDGIDVFLFAPHVDIDAGRRSEKLADKVRAKNLAIGSVVAPVWGGTGGGSAMGNDADRKNSSRRCAKGVGSPRSCANSVSVPTASCALIRPAAPAIGSKIPKAIRNALPRRFARPAILPRISANDWPRKAKSAGGHA